MKKKLLLVCMALLSLLNASAQGVPINSSTNGADVWYYIQCRSRSTDLNAKWLTGGVTKTAYATLTPMSSTDDSQLWKIVSNGNGFALQNKMYGNYLNADVPRTTDAASILDFVAALPTTALKLCTYVDQTYANGLPGSYYMVNVAAVEPILNGVAKPTMTFQFYSAGGGTQFRPMNYGSNGPNFNCALRFVLPSDYTTGAYLLLEAIASAKGEVTKAPVGENPGQYAAADIAVLQSAISTAQGIYDAGTQTDYTVPTTTLKDAISLFKSQIILPVISTSGNERWYYLQGTRPLNSYMTAAAAGQFTQIKDLDIVPNDYQLWKFVANPNGTADGFVLVNKATGEYMAADSIAGGTKITLPDGITTRTATGFLPTTTTMPTNNLRFIQSTEFTADNTARFWIENTTASTPAFRLHAGAGNSAWGIINWLGSATDNCTWLIIDYNTGLKTILSSALVKVKAFYDGASEGVNPGQLDHETYDALTQTIEYSQAILDDPNSTTQQCFDATTELNTTLALMKSKVVTPDVSDATTEKWYYLQSPKDPTYYLRSNGTTPSSIYCNQLELNDDRFLWKFVQNTNGGADGYALQNKANQEYLNTDLADSKLVGTILAMPSLNIVPAISDATTNKVFRFWIKNSDSSASYLLHVGGGNELWNYSGASTGNGAFLILPEADILRTQFLALIQTSRVKYDATASNIGEEFGQYSATTRSNVNNVLTAESGKDISALTNEDFIAGINRIKEVMTTLHIIDDISKISLPTQNKWFRFINAGTSTYASGKAFTSTGRTVDQKFTLEAKDVNSDAQLFRIELDFEGKKIVGIYNKGLQSYLGADGTILAAPTEGVQFAVQLADAFSFTIKPTGLNPIHVAEANLDAMNYQVDGGRVSTWKFEYAKVEDIADLSGLYISTRTQARAKYDEALSLSGTEFGQYSAASVGSFGTVLTAEEAKDAASLTQAQLQQGILDLRYSFANLVVNTDIKLLASSTGTDKWFRLVNGANASVVYASGMVMTSNGRSATEPFSFEAKDVTSDAQLFKFELNADQTKVVKMINKANGLYMGVDGLISDAPTAENEFEITQLEGGRTFWIYPTAIDVTDPANPTRYSPLHAAESNQAILNYYDGVGSASAWIFESLSGSNSVKNTEAFTYNVRTINNIITVNGVENFEVYSVLGQKQNTKKALNNGVYFVKVNNAVKKVILK